LYLSLETFNLKIVMYKDKYIVKVSNERFYFSEAYSIPKAKTTLKDQEFTPQHEDSYLLIEEVWYNDVRKMLDSKILDYNYDGSKDFNMQDWDIANGIISLK
jgi:hypothetical protein